MDILSCFSTSLFSKGDNFRGLNIEFHVKKPQSKRFTLNPTALRKAKILFLAFLSAIGLKERICILPMRISLL